MYSDNARALTDTSDSTRDYTDSDGTAAGMYLYYYSGYVDTVSYTDISSVIVDRQARNRRRAQEVLRKWIVLIPVMLIIGSRRKKPFIKRQREVRNKPCVDVSSLLLAFFLWRVGQCQQ